MLSLRKKQKVYRENERIKSNARFASRNVRLTYNSFLLDGLHVYEPLVTRADDYRFFRAPVVRIAVRDCVGVQNIRGDVIQDPVGAVA